NLQFGDVHNRRQFRDEKEPSSIQHSLFAEREWLYPREINQIFKDFSYMKNRTGAHLLRIFLEAVFPILLSEKLITAKKRKELFDVTAIDDLSKSDVTGICCWNHHEDVVGTYP